MCATHCRESGGCAIHIVAPFVAQPSSSSQSADFLLSLPPLPSSQPQEFPLPNTNFKEQMRPVFTQQQAVETQLQERQQAKDLRKKEAKWRSTHTVDLILWHEVTVLFCSQIIF
jgi:hypothetical protein